MKFTRAPNRSCSGQFMAEACIGLALMTFVWIILTYSLFMANNDIRTEMAARYAAWYQGANGSGTIATASQMDQYFFFQSGLSAVKAGTPETVSSFFPPFIPKGLTKLFDLSDGTAANGPFKVSVSFGVSSVSSSSAFPFNLLSTHVPFMPDSNMTNALSVSSSCQWDGVADTWTSADTVLKVIWNMLKNLVSSFF